MALRFEAEELDEATLEYLQTASEYEGEGMPGVYLNASEAGLELAGLAGCGAAGGVVLVLTMLIYLMVGDTSDPTTVAMLQPAGLMLGCWLLIAWSRTKVGQKRDDYLGHFKYLDSEYLWHGTGRGVWAYPLGRIEEIRVKHNHNNEGNYSGSVLTVETSDGTVTLATKSVDKAEEAAA